MELFAKPSASAIIVKSANSKRYILIQERFKESVPLENGLLEIPGGKIREFENIYDCLRREVKEETGLDVIKIQGENDSTIIDYNGYTVLSYTPFACTQNIKGYYPIMNEAFICETSGNLLTCTNEAKNMRWIPLEELSNLLLNHENSFYPMHIAALKKYSRIFNVLQAEV